MCPNVPPRALVDEAEYKLNKIKYKGQHCLKEALEVRRRRLPHFAGAPDARVNPILYKFSWK